MSPIPSGQDIAISIGQVPSQAVLIVPAQQYVEFAADTRVVYTQLQLTARSAGPSTSVVATLLELAARSAVGGATRIIVAHLTVSATRIHALCELTDASPGVTDFVLTTGSATAAAAVVITFHACAIRGATLVVCADLALLAASLATAFEFTHAGVLFTKLVLAAGPAVDSAQVQAALQAGTIRETALAFIAQCPRFTARSRTVQECALAQPAIAIFQQIALSTTAAAAVFATFRPGAIRGTASAAGTNLSGLAAYIAAAFEFANTRVTLAYLIVTAGPAIQAAQVQSTLQPGAIGLAAGTLKADLPVTAAPLVAPFKLTDTGIVLAQLIGATVPTGHPTDVHAALQTRTVRLTALPFKAGLTVAAAGLCATAELAGANVVFA